MQNKELCLHVEAIANEKHISINEMFGVLQEALETAFEKRTKQKLRIEIDRKTGDFRAFRQWLVVANDAHSSTENMAFDDNFHIKHKDAGGLDLDSYYEKEVGGFEFGRITAQIAKQAIIQKVKEAERTHIVDQFQERIGEMASVTVKRTDRGNIHVDLGNIDGIIAKSDSIPNELLHKGDRIKALIKDIQVDGKGVQIFLTRVANEMLVKLFTMEVPEIANGVIQIMGVARDPGLRAKIAIRTRDQRIDPIGSCIGMRGTRVQAVSNGLNGERVDVVLWDANPAEFVMHAMAPANVVSILIDEPNHSMEVAVKEEDLAPAIGRNGQNVRLASEVTGWQINVMSEQVAQAKRKEEAKVLAKDLAKKLRIDLNIADTLVDAEYISVDDVMSADKADLSALPGFSDIVDDLKDRAEDAALAEALGLDEAVEALMTLSGIDEPFANMLVTAGVTDQEALANLSIDELIEIYPIDRDRASEVIMQARAPWFDE